MTCSCNLQATQSAAFRSIILSILMSSTILALPFSQLLKIREHLSLQITNCDINRSSFGFSSSCLPTIASVTVPLMCEGFILWLGGGVDRDYDVNWKAETTGRLIHCQIAIREHAAEACYWNQHGQHMQAQYPTKNEDFCMADNEQ